MVEDPEPRHIIIIGGGVIGCCTAYYLSRHPSYDRQRDTITIVEAAGIAAAASGKAGGLLASWAYPSCIVPLSFQLHDDLAAQYDGANRWGYRRIHCARIGMRGQSAPARPPTFSISPSGTQRQTVLHDMPRNLDWLYVEKVETYRPVGTPENTAQVTPYEFTTAMAEMAVEGGATVVLGMVTTINKEKGKVRSVTYTVKEGIGYSSESKTLRATDVIVCAGPWTSKIFPAAPIVGLRQNSVIIRTLRSLSAYMLFTEISVPTTGTQRSQHVTPEIFTRPNNTVWAAGETDND